MGNKGEGQKSESKGECPTSDIRGILHVKMEAV